MVNSLLLIVYGEKKGKNMSNDKDSSNKKGRRIPTNPTRFGVKHALRMNHVSMPWKRALGSALATSIPVLLGVLFNQLIFGVTASLGAFTYLYTSNESYSQRAKKIGIIAIALSLSMVLGTLLAPHILSLSIVIGLIGTIAFYVFHSLRIIGPGAIFFVLVFAVATGLPIDPSAALERGFFVLMGGLLSWIIAMVGWFIHPLKPERNAIMKVYTQMEALIKAIGTDHFHHVQHSTVLSLSQADSILSRKVQSDKYKKLLLLHQKANRLFLTLTALSHKQNQADLEPYIEQLAEINRAIISDTKSKLILNQKNSRYHDIHVIEEELLAIVNVLNNKTVSQSIVVTLPQQSVWYTLHNGLNRHSLVLPNALVYGITVFIAALFSYSIGFDRPYWVPVACAAVMLGANTTFTIHRAIQRSLGTLVGIAIGGIILTFGPSGIALFFLIGILQFFVESVIVRNYVYANMFIAPLVLIIVETLNPGNSISYFVSARAFDTVIGSIIGVVGVLTLWRDLSHRYVPKSLSETLLSISSLLKNMEKKNQINIGIAEQKVLTNLINFRMVYDRTLGDFSRKNTNAESYWPAIMYTQHLGYLFITYSRDQHPIKINDTDYARLSELFQLLSHQVTQKNSSNTMLETDEIISEEVKTDINGLQKAIMLVK